MPGELITFPGRCTYPFFILREPILCSRACRCTDLSVLPLLIACPSFIFHRTIGRVLTVFVSLTESNAQAPIPLSSVYRGYTIAVLADSPKCTSQLVPLALAPTLPPLYTKICMLHPACVTTTGCNLRSKGQIPLKCGPSIFVQFFFF